MNKNETLGLSKQGEKMKHSLIAYKERKTRLLNERSIGFSIDPFSGRYWYHEEYSEKLKRNVERKIRVFSLDEAMSSSECLEDSYKPRGARIAYFLEE